MHERRARLLRLALLHCTLALAAALDDAASPYPPTGAPYNVQAGDAAARQHLLATNVLVALTNQSAAWLWAATTEAVEHPTSTIATLAAAIVDYCSNTAAMLFADAAADFTTGVMAGAAQYLCRLVQHGPCWIS